MHAMPASPPIASSPVSSVTIAAAAQADGIQIAIDGATTEQIAFHHVLAAQILGAESKQTLGADEPPADSELQELPEFLVAQLAAGIGLSPSATPPGQASPITQVKNFLAGSEQIDSRGLAMEEGGAGAGGGKSGQATPLLDSLTSDELIASSGVPPAGSPVELVSPSPHPESPAGEVISPVPGGAGTDVQKSAGTTRPPDGFNPRHIPEPVKNPAWGEALGQRILWMAKENLHVVHLQVEPPHLGSVEVQLVLNRDQASLVFASPHASVREAISESLFKLDSLLSAGGVSLGGVSVNSQSQSHQHDRSGGRSGEPAGTWFAAGALAEAPHPRVRANVGLVDTFA